MTDRSTKGLVRTALFVTTVGLYSTPASAYLDPGTGSMLVQGLIGAIAAAAFTVKLYWHKVKALFRTKGPSEKPGAEVSTKRESND